MPHKKAGVIYKGNVMKLTELTEKLNNVYIYGDADISDVSSSSKHKGENWLFICNEKRPKNMNAYVREAKSNGAVAIICAEKADADIPQAVTNDVRYAYSFICSEFFSRPQDDMKIVAVVGTNGKTTTAHLIGKILNFAGINCGVIGTLGAFYNGKEEPLDLTTHDPEDFFALLKRMRDGGVKIVVTELSAHAIYYKKLACIYFEAIIFTNCTQDHLDFFRDMESYFAAKASVFCDEKCKYKIINADDPYGREIIRQNNKNVLSYGIKNPSDVFALRIKYGAGGTDFFLNALDSVERVKTSLIGNFNVYNSLAAITFSVSQNIPLKSVVAALKECKAISGRLEMVAEYNGATIYVDYAHTPDGLENALLTLGKITRNNLICLFGCGGNRDKTKRSTMGKVAGDIADFVIITSDNPRFEDPDKIISEVECGVREATWDYVCIKDRFNAIKYAVRSLSHGDVLLIAGKGAEEYQEVLGVKKPFSDKKAVNEVIGGLSTEK